MSKEQTLANIAKTAYWDTESENKDTFDRVAKAVEKEVLERLKNDEEEHIIAGQELNNYQVLRWIEKHGSTKGLQYMSLTGLLVDDENTLSCVVDAEMRYRVSHKKTNNPDDPTSWENGVAIFARDSEYDAWSLDVFSCYLKNVDFKYVTDFSEWRYAKLATPEQIEAWKLINDEWEYAT